MTLIQVPGSIGYDGPTTVEAFWLRHWRDDRWPKCVRLKCQMPACVCPPGSIEEAVCYAHATTTSDPLAKWVWILLREK